MDVMSDIGITDNGVTEMTLERCSALTEAILLAHRDGVLRGDTVDAVWYAAWAVTIERDPLHYASSLTIGARDMSFADAAGIVFG